MEKNRFGGEGGIYVCIVTCTCMYIDGAAENKNPPRGVYVVYVCIVHTYCGDPSLLVKIYVVKYFVCTCTYVTILSLAKLEGQESEELFPFCSKMKSTYKYEVHPPSPPST